MREPYLNPMAGQKLQRAIGWVSGFWYAWTTCDLVVEDGPLGTRLCVRGWGPNLKKGEGCAQ